MPKISQRERILHLLTQRGKVGVTAFEAVYQMGITRMAAIVFDLRQEGYDIETLDDGRTPDGKNKTARYVLLPPKPAAGQTALWD